MKTKIIKKPTVVPIHEIGGLTDIPETDFPFYYKAYTEGVEMYIRDGHIFLVGTDERVTNMALIDELELIRTASSNLRAIIKLTVSNKAHADYIYHNLKDVNYKLPADTVYNFTDLIFKHHPGDMNVINGDANLKLIAGGFRSHPNWKFHTHNLAIDLDSFVRDAIPLLYMDNVIGVTIYRSDSTFSMGKDYSMVSLKLIGDVDAEVIDMEADIKHHGYNFANLASKIKVLSGGSIVEVDVSHLPQLKKLNIWKARHYFRGKKVKIKAGKNKSKRLTIIKDVKLVS